MTTDATTNPSEPAVDMQQQKEKEQDAATTSLEAQIEDLEVSKPESKADIHEEHQQQPHQQDEGVKAVTEQVDEERLEATEDNKQDGSSEGESSTHTSDDEGDGPKELGLVISALQSTIKQNQERAQPIEQEKHDGEKPEEQKEGEQQGLREEGEEEELHSIGRSSVDDNNSVTTSTTNVSQEEEKVVVEDPNMPSTFEEIVQDILPPTPGVAPQRQTFDFGGRPSEDISDIDTYSANLIALNKIDMKEIKANTLSPRQQERADEPVLRAIRHLFNNRFMKAKKLFEKQAETDPLHALGLGSMAFLKGR
ncbi:Endoribonuclease L-PSP [Mucor velutinosus]|uniref:Endoribonuclease L-PSP n=1 Tax=Mucor velutinosus TaxID=708070 RepID=A0AAN7HV06_9FUNG|nr:Endoribonuclease L-PSP [Mucor velutinosus]